MRLAALVSGGKDSIAAAWLAQKAGHEIKYFVSVQPKTAESYMFHYPNTKFVAAQAKVAGIWLIEVKTAGDKEAELGDLEEALRKIKNEIDGVVTGAIASGYQKSRIEKLCAELKLKHIAPLWQIDAVGYWQMLLENKFEIMITAAAAAGLTQEWLGKIIGIAELAKLKELATRHKFSPVGEGGEFETFVLDCPMFKKAIDVEKAVTHWDNVTQSGQFIIEKIRLVEKS